MQTYLSSVLSMHNIKIKEMEMLDCDLLNIMEREQKKQANAFALLLLGLTRTVISLSVSHPQSPAVRMGLFGVKLDSDSDIAFEAVLCYI